MTNADGALLAQIAEHAMTEKGFIDFSIAA